MPFSMRDSNPLNPSRWLVAALVPLAFLGTGAVVTGLWPAFVLAEIMVGGIIGPALTVVYLYRVHGASVHWLWPLMILMFGLAIDGALAISATRHGHIHPGAAVAAVIAGAVGVVLLELAVLGAAANGARWVHGFYGSRKQRYELLASGRGSVALRKALRPSQLILTHSTVNSLPPRRQPMGTVTVTRLPSPVLSRARPGRTGSPVRP
ncbi:MAG TPA: hypothetical protein VE733_13700 [Streptosporangiaceae bacterium]|jgi:hypothetical protein|nr:hypothetical protein [Streptosporangiaceae bacterium]